MTTFIGKPVTLIGQELKVGQIAPEFTLITTDLQKKSLTDFKGKKVISVIPSIDTGICSTQTRVFNKEVSEMKDTHVLTISVDLPFAQARWCGDEGLDKAIMLSDYFDHSFGQAYGLLMKEWKLLARAVFVLDASNQIVYVQYLENVNSEPDYLSALTALKSIT
ncbi:thiol peroxidase [Streptococcus iniae]|uniref:Thiol peroxidase n=1 Tax=Streptococcus iniae TaxID=1346 RepID=A0A3L8GJ35_STRIN|nr:thiol peroxidase [Streptococcus iniae]AGM98735.1 thiol peroxidase [Streptococcus iniae SF1]AHY15700.1 thiol peroxidase [Streptococcus iniae]AHY17568.1 thiol peroxidase [Streptococcus iniae]AJG25869.1 thiol peroxidase [Streptococcus iniae]APD31740.1 lipid hydroperoxide peroxidase [Streptococcus iniae]